VRDVAGVVTPAKAGGASSGLPWVFGLTVVAAGLPHGGSGVA
jgi:hypothetical protein